VNGLGKVSDLCTPHQEYLSLGSDSGERQRNYRELFVHHVDGKLLEEIRTSTRKGMAIGNDRFKEEIEALTGRRLRSKKRGRPVGWRKEII
jgi:putative transposase